MKVIKDSVKVSIAVAVAIFIANVFHLEHAISAGIVAVLSIRPTKRETVNVALGRLIAFLIALCLAKVTYFICGFNQFGFLLFVIPYTFICYIKKWTASITLNSVLVSHFITYGKMDGVHILNEVLIFVIGVGVGILVNLNLNKKEAYIEKLKDETDEQIVQILQKIGKAIQNKEELSYNDICFKQLEHILREAKNTAEENYNNQLRQEDTADIEYIAMRQKQYHILYDMYEMVNTLETTPATAEKIAGFYEKMANVFHRHNDGIELMADFKELDLYMKKQPLPAQRQEFEDRARLFVLMRYIEEFIDIKVKFKSNGILKKEKAE